MSRRIVIVSMGCSKNLVDSERVAAMLENEGFKVYFDSDDVDDAIVVINTCGFINDAKEESIGMILNASKLREEGRIKGLYVMGCLTERYRSELSEELDVDGLFGKFEWNAVVKAITEKEKAAEGYIRKQSTLPHYTYVKVSEGCNRFCAFCAIPLITGRHKSRSVTEICEEVRAFVEKGVKEFNIIAQDLSAYGTDLDGRSHLAELLETLADIKGVEMLRLHYAYPADFPFEILPVMASRPNVCKYLDIALQHIDDTVLTNMQRHITAEQTRSLLARIRAEVPGIHIRTTMMVGFPSEDEAAFERLIDFVREQRFERLGAFAYCEEDDTFAAKHYDDNIPDEVKQKRLERLMSVQHDIATEVAAAKVGKVMRVIIDSEDEGYYVGRTEFDSPEVDCEVLIAKNRELKPGEIYNVKILKTDDYDLIGEVSE